MKEARMSDTALQHPVTRRPLSDRRPQVRCHDNAANRHGQDRQAMKLGNFTGIRGFPNQDIAMQESMGPIADRTGERLGASDLAIVQFRRTMIQAARDVQAGKPPPGLGIKASDYPSYGSWERVTPKSTDWRTVRPDAETPAAE